METHRYEKPYQYRDGWIRFAISIIAAHIVTEYGGRESWYKRIFTADYYQEFGSTLIITFLITYLVFKITSFLDQRFDWNEKTLVRFMMQLLLGLVLPSVITFLLAALYFYLYGANILDYNYHLYAFPFIVSLIAIFNIYYLVRYLHADKLAYKHQLENQNTIETPDLNQPSQETQAKAAITIHTPTGSFQMPVSNIAYFYRTSGRVYVRSFMGTDQLVAQSLDQIEQMLNNKSFFRAARHVIVNHKAIVRYFPLNFGKIGIELKPPFKEELNVSKLQAREFKNWFNS
ncbi:LytTR family transcriptional regulator DNA-binding domain-containing protein [Chitinophaga sp. RCC_12]|uniref:LytTR family transcriptional regulator DNA-binding domain-containing protein n=1 Tax=Chitinophaga sp. RCC_12 TaxID=3239226 RepID=UPI0035268770